MPEVVYNRHKFRLNDVFFGAGAKPTNIQALLLETTAAGAQDPDINTVADLLAVGGVVEMSGGSYARQTLASVTITEDDTNNRAAVDSGNIVFGAVSGKAALALVLFESGASDAARLLISYHDTGFGTLLTPMAGGLTLNVSDFIRTA